ncbi:MAG: hypothetical protein DRJ64_06995 [Thermoprotei archaeon]|nr:MAG: hypothetical protein DRJ64_06995 [Thermoprotei archaeon]
MEDTGYAQLEPEEQKFYMKFEEGFRELDDMWEKYRSASVDLICGWDRYRVKLLDKVSKLAGIVSSIQVELNELKVKVELGLLDSEKANRRIEKLGEKLKKLEARLISLRNFLETFEKWSLVHRKRIGPLPTVSGAEEIHGKLKELDELYNSGQVREDVYKRIKAELETLLKIIEE